MKTCLQSTVSYGGSQLTNKLIKTQSNKQLRKVSHWMEHTWRWFLKSNLQTLPTSHKARHLSFQLCSPTRRKFPLCPSRSNEQSKTKTSCPLRNWWSSIVDSVDSSASQSSPQRLTQELQQKSTSLIGSYTRINLLSLLSTPQSFLHLARSSVSLRNQFGQGRLTLSSPLVKCSPLTLLSVSWRESCWLGTPFVFTRRRQRLGICSSTLQILSISSLFNCRQRLVYRVTSSSLVARTVLWNVRSTITSSIQMSLWCLSIGEYSLCGTRELGTWTQWSRKNTKSSTLRRRRTRWLIEIPLIN